MNTDNKTCPVCGVGMLHEHVIQEESEYKGQRGKTPLSFSECDTCGVEQTDPYQARANKRAMIAFKKSVDGLLTGQEGLLAGTGFKLG
jgi:HTH-type transcriptional regulator/antitoxin MqsA